MTILLPFKINDHFPCTDRRVFFFFIFFSNVLFKQSLNRNSLPKFQQHVKRIPFESRLNLSTEDSAYVEMLQICECLLFFSFFYLATTFFLSNSRYKFVWSLMTVLFNFFLHRWRRGRQLFKWWLVFIYIGSFRINFLGFRKFLRPVNDILQSTYHTSDEELSKV